jgi:DNA-binding transcriptional LysR family regulator
MSMDRLGAMAQFVRVVETGSFSAAARILGVGQPAISKAVAQLEIRLGTTLLTRTTRALTPTDAGRVFYDRAKAALDAVEEAEAATRGAGASLSGRLRVCAPVTFARLHIMPTLPAFMTRHPALELDFVLDDRRIDLIEEGIDVAIRAGPLTDSAMVAARIATGRRHVIGNPDFWRRGPAVCRPADLAALPFIAYGPAPYGTEWIFASEERTETVQMRPCLRVSALEGVRESVLAGIGCAVVSQWSVKDMLEERRIESRLDAWQLPTVDLWAIFPAGRQPSARARLFIDHIKSVI